MQITPALIIFDCDGTLVDSESVNNRALIDVLHEDGFGPYDLTHALTHWMGRTVSAIFLQIQMETGRAPSPDLGMRYVRRVASLQTHGLVAVDGALDVLKSIKGRIPICVASNGERQNVLQSLTLTGFMDFFTQDQVFTKSQVKNPKPAPDLFLFAAQSMGVQDPKQCLVIEDSVTGVSAGVSAGMHVWGFTGTAHRKESHALTLKQAGASRIIDRFIHIKDNITL
jgi:beta-phosphoglucomutase-like phosphatase (HAD superfamily)